MKMAKIGILMLAALAVGWVAAVYIVIALVAATERRAEQWLRHNRQYKAGEARPNLRVVR